MGLPRWQYLFGCESSLKCVIWLIRLGKIMCCLKRINSTSSRSNPYSDRSFSPPLLLRAFLPKVSRLFHLFFSSCLIAHVSLRSHGFCVGRGVILSSIEGPRYITVAGEWAHRAVWNHWYMEPKRGYNLGQLWADHATDIIQKVTSSREVTSDDIQRVCSKQTHRPAAGKRISPRPWNP